MRPLRIVRPPPAGGCGGSSAGSVCILSYIIVPRNGTCVDCLVLLDCTITTLQSHHAAPTPITQTESSMADRFQAGRFGSQMSSSDFMAWHHHWRTWSFNRDGVSKASAFRFVTWTVPDSQPTTTDLFQSPLYASGTVFRSISHLLRHFPSSTLAWIHTSSNSVTCNYCCCAYEVKLSFMDTLIAFTYLLIVCQSCADFCNE